MKTAKPACPFCGSQHLAVLKSQDDPGGGPDYMVLCQGCRAGGPTRKEQGAAILAWTTRAGKAPLAPSES
jgi:hypothetical protein